MEILFKDIRYGCRTLLRNPGFTIVAVLSLALGIGANTAIFSFVNTILLKPLPVNNPRELVWFGPGIRRGVMQGTPGESMELFSWRTWQALDADRSAFRGVAAVFSRMVRVYVNTTSGTPESGEAGLVSGNFFSLLGVQPRAGRFFSTETDSAPGSSPYAVLSDGYWERKFHRRPSAIGQALNISGVAYTIVGIAPPEFFGLQVGEAPDLWLPLSMQPKMPGANDYLPRPELQFANLIGRLNSNATVAQAQAVIDVQYRRLIESQFPSGDAESKDRLATAHVQLTSAERGVSALRRQLDLPLRVLMAVVGLVLLIACANVANLLACQAMRRRRELAVRVAIGAARLRVIRQLLTESLLLAAAGGALGILVAQGAGALLVHLISTGPRALPLGFDPDTRVLAFTALLALGTGILFGIVPALRASRVDLNTSLKEGKSAKDSPRKVTFPRLMVASQVALSLALLVTAGLLLHSFSKLAGAETGFDRQNVLVFKLDTAASGYKEGPRLASLYVRLEDAVSRLPDVLTNGVSLSSFNDGTRYEGFSAAGISAPPDERVVPVNIVTSAFFGTFRIPFVSGRNFTAEDRAGAERVAIVSEAFARNYFGADNAIGKILSMNPTEDTGDKEIVFRIVGVVQNTKTRDVREKPQSLLYLSLAQVPVYAGNLTVRVKGEFAPATAAVRRAIAAIEPNLPIRSVTTLADAVSDSLFQERAIAQLSTLFAALALGLAAIGLYGTISFAVTRRTAEIGLRMALGANRSGVVRMVLLDAVTIVGAGVLVGAPLGWLAGRTLSSLLFELRAADPLSLGLGSAVLILVAGAASLIPALRASRVDPIAALRYE